MANAKEIDQIKYHSLGFTEIKIRNFYVLLFLLFLTACGEGPPSQEKPVDKRFRTTPPSRIYFQNIRSIAYQWEQPPESRTDYYVLRKIAAASDEQALYPVIADIWLEDKAYILLKSKLHQPIPTPLKVFWKSGNDQEEFLLKNLNPDQQHQLVMNIYLASAQGRQLQIMFPEESPKPLFSNDNARANFMLTVRDYLRLTENL